MEEGSLIGLILVLANVGISYKGFNDNSFFEKYKFNIDKILIEKEYIRLISSGFLHVDWMHLGFNMFSLFFFSASVENLVGGPLLLLIYFSSMIGGDLLALFVHRNHGDYSAVGASGAVCGIIFASIALFPGMGIGFFGLPFFIPGWIYGIIYVGYSIYGISSSKDNIGHEAHLGGALVGMLVAIVVQPSAIENNYITILIITIPTLVFIYIIITRPHVLLINNTFFKSQKSYFDIEHEYQEKRADKQQELDYLLDKINKRGINSLSKRERQRLDELSK